MQMTVLQGCLKKDVSAVWAKVFGVSAFVTLLCFSAYIKVPLFFTPVPVTMQTLVVILAGAFLGSRLAMASVGFYLALGLSGVPLFANAGTGLAYLAGPTGGYILGFFAAAALTGRLLNRPKEQSFALIAFSMALGIAVIYALGGIWLASVYGWSFKGVVTLGVAPFVLPDAAKVLIASFIYKRFKQA